MKETGKQARRKELEATAESFLGSVKTPPPSVRLREYGLQHVFARAETSQKEGKGRVTGRAYGRPVLLYRMVVVAMAALMLMLVSTASAYALSSDAQPGSALYGTKIFFERASVALTRSSTEDIKLEMEFSNRRMRELEKMVADGDQSGAERWLREYQRNLTEASGLLDSAGGDMEGLSLQYEYMLERQAHMMSGMHGVEPPGLARSIEGAYSACEGERMRHRHGQGGEPAPSQPPGDPQQQERCPQMMDGSSTQEAPSYPSDNPTTEGEPPMQDSPGTQDAATPNGPMSPDGGQGQQGSEGSEGMHEGLPVWWP